MDGLAQQIAAADSLVGAARQRRDEAALAAEQADQTRAGLPDKAQIQRQLEMYALRRELVAEAELQTAALAACSEKEAKLAAELEAADLALAVAHDAVDAAQRAHAAAGLAETLHVGDDCPVCQQQVTALPRHVAPADLSAARSALDTATKAQRQARTVHDAAAKATVSAKSALDGTQARLGKASLVMADAESEADLASLLDSITAADAAMTAARAQAAVRQTELSAAERSRAALAAGEQRAWAQLSSTRDTLVALGAPAIAAGAGHDLAAAWATLSSWAASEAGNRAARLPELQAAADQVKLQFDAAALALAEVLAEHDVDADPLTRAPARVTDLRARTEAQLHGSATTARKAAKLDVQIAAHQEDAQVAAMLGNLPARYVL